MTIGLAFVSGHLAGADSHQPRLEQRQHGGTALANLQPFLLEGSGRVSAVVLGRSGARILQTAPNEPHVLASVAKVYILLAFLDSVSADDRPLEPDEVALMEGMIAESDNDAADELWRRAGGRDGLQTFLSEKAMPPVQVPRDDSWGDIQASANDVAVLLLSLYNGDLLDGGHTRIALRYMSNVIASQSWGLGIARQQGSSGTTSVYFKNGWYPADEGWIVNTAGIVDGRFGTQIIVFLTDSQPSLEEGQRFLRGALLLLEDYLSTMMARIATPLRQEQA
jgi:hypothetical protein